MMVSSYQQFLHPSCPWRPMPTHPWHTRRMPRLLIVHHSPTETMRRLSRAVLSGAHDDAITGVEVVELAALDFATGKADHQSLLDADGYILGTTANFGYMSGALKHMFDSTFVKIGGALGDDGAGVEAPSGATSGRPFGLYLHGRYDATGAIRSVTSITGALGWKQAFKVIEPLGELHKEDLDQAYELGATLSALVLESA